MHTRAVTWLVKTKMPSDAPRFSQFARSEKGKIVVDEPAQERFPFDGIPRAALEDSEDDDNE